MGPPTQAELEAIVKDRWIEIDRPDAARTTHAVVVNQDPARDAAARALAEKLAASLRDVPSGSDLIARARQFPSEGFDVRAENLPFVTTDGRTFDRRGERFVDAHQDFDLAFARAANELERPGQLSSVVKSKYGYHVIRLEERAPGSVVPKAELPTLLGPEVFAARAKRARADLLEPLRQASSVQILRAADELTSKVHVR
jgi:peptidyl-prolyl cis-trans isomerase C